MTITIGRGPLRLGGGMVIGQAGVQLAGGGASQPYDNTPSIAAAFGMRRLLTSYTSNILRLRRSSDNAESDFGYTATGDLDTATIATWLGADSGYVVTWYDQSGNGDNVTQATAANQPLYVASGQNSLPVARFDGSDDLLVSDTGGATGNAAHSVVAVLAQLTLASLRGIVTLGRDSTGTNKTSTVGTINTKWWFGGDDQVTPASAADTNTSYYVAAKTANGTTVTGYANGAQVATGALTYDLDSGLVLGAYLATGGYANCDIGEAIICNAALSVADRGAAETAANTYWEIY